MRTSRIAAAVATFILSEVNAFPAIALEAAAVKARRDSLNVHEKRINGILPGFDAATQYIDVTGANKFVPPDLSTELRGPCPVSLHRHLLVYAYN